MREKALREQYKRTERSNNGEKEMIDRIVVRA
jgi:hypothetical protein